MKNAILLSAALLALAADAGAYSAPPPPKSAAGAAMQFERLRGILGAWEGTTKSGKPIAVWYKLIAGGTTLHESLRFGEDPEMVTLIHLDGDNLDLEHYCSAGNQPHMRAKPQKAEKLEDLKSVDFDFLDARNLSDPSVGHMDKMTLEFTDADHFTESWQWVEKGEKTLHSLKLSRKKTSQESPVPPNRAIAPIPAGAPKI